MPVTVTMNHHVSAGEYLRYYLFTCVLEDQLRAREFVDLHDQVQVSEDDWIASFFILLNIVSTDKRELARLFGGFPVNLSERLVGCLWPDSKPTGSE